MTRAPVAISRARVASKPATAHGPALVHTTLVSWPKMPSTEIGPRPDQPVAEQVQPEPGVLGGGRRGLEVGDLDEADLPAHPAHVVRPGQRHQLGRRVAAVVVAESGCGEPRVEDGAALVESRQAQPQAFAGASLTAHDTIDAPVGPAA